MAEQKNQVIKSGVWYIISNVLIRAVGILTSPIYTRMLSTAEKGIADSFNMWLTIINSITCLCLIYSVGRAKIDFSEKFDEYLSAIQTLSSTFTLITFGFFLWKFSGIFQGEFTFPMLVMMFVYLVIFPSIDYMQYKYRFNYQYKENIIISIIICISTVILSVVFMAVLPNDRALGKITGTVIPVIIVGIWCYITILRSGKVIFKKEYWLYALKIGLPTIPHGLAMVLLARMDMVMILSFCGASDAGIYSTGYTIATLLSVVTNAIGQAWLPWFNEQLHIEKREAIKKNNLLLMQLGCFLTLGFIVVAPEATKILCHSKFWGCIWVIPAVAIGTLCQYFYTNYVNVELYYKKTFLIALNSVIAAFLNYTLNSIYIPLFGFVAAAYTTLVGYFALMILHYLSTRWILKIKIYSDAAYFGLMVGTGILGISILFLYHTILLRYGISILLLGFFAFMKRNDIMLLTDIIKTKLGRKS